MSVKKGHGTEHCATFDEGEEEESEVTQEAQAGMEGGGGIGRDARTDDGYGEDGENLGEGLAVNS